MFFSTISK